MSETILKVSWRDVFGGIMTEPDEVALPTSLPLAAFTALIERHHHALYTFLRHFVGDDEQAYDLLQDTLYEAWRVARQGTPPFRATSDEDQQRRWLFRVATRVWPSGGDAA
jgi:DNA-directed RNA polymerase specialized sigma24 family protein